MLLLSLLLGLLLLRANPGDLARGLLCVMGVLGTRYLLPALLLLLLVLLRRAVLLLMGRLSIVSLHRSRKLLVLLDLLLVGVSVPLRLLWLLLLAMGGLDLLL